MRLIRFTIVALIISFIIFIACDDSPTRYSKPPVETNFPNGVGMLWKYEIYDSLAQTTDTVWFSVTDTSTLEVGKHCTEWKGKSNASGNVDWKYLTFSDDTLDIFNGPIYDRPILLEEESAIERIVFPLELGRGWTGLSSFIDTSTVTLVGQIEVPAGRFNNGARIDREWEIGFEGGGNWSQTWSVPNVGIVSRYYLSQYSDGGNITVTKNETWELIDYDLTTFTINQFPNKVGNEWIYEQKDSVYYAHDSIIITYDTVTVSIIRDGQLWTGDPFTVWEYLSDNFNNTQFVVTQGNHLAVMLDTTQNSFINAWLDFPLAVGVNWGVDSFVPVPQMLDKDEVITPFQTFQSAFHRQMISGSFVDLHPQDDWFVPMVGIVKTTIWGYGFIPSTYTTRTLIDYNLVD